LHAKWEGAVAAVELLREYGGHSSAACLGDVDGQRCTCGWSEKEKELGDE